MKRTCAVLLLGSLLLILVACNNMQAQQPKPTARPTIQPTSTVPVNHFSDVTLRLADLPSGFAPLPPDDEFFNAAQAFEDAAQEARFGFTLKGRNPEIILGITFLLPTAEDVTKFDSMLTDSDWLNSMLVDSVSKRVSSKHPIRNLERIGDVSAGMTATYVEGQDRWTMDTALFRQGEVAVFIAMAYLEDDLPALSVDTFAYKLGERAKRLAAAPEQANTIDPSGTPLHSSTEEPALIWKEYAPRGGKFSISAPGKPKESTPAMTSFDGKKVTSHMAEFTAKKGKCAVEYSVGYFDQLAVLKSKQTPQTMLEIWRDIIVATRIGKLVKTTPFMQQDYAGLDTMLEGAASDQTSAFTLRFRIYLVKSRFYYAAVTASPECYKPADADRFLYSFQLIKP